METIAKIGQKVKVTRSGKIAVIVSVEEDTQWIRIRALKENGEIDYSFMNVADMEVRHFIAMLVSGEYELI